MLDTNASNLPLDMFRKETIDLAAFLRNAFPDEAPQAGVLEALMQACQQEAFRSISRRFETEHLTIDIWTGNSVSATAILDHCRHLSGVDSDCFFFYYTGHGARSAQRGHYLDLAGGPLFRDDLREAIMKKPPGLGVILTDCCAVFHEPSTGKEGAAQKDGDSQEPLVNPTRDLLLMHRGLVDITSCDMDQVSYGTVFSRALKRCLANTVQLEDFPELDSDGDGFVNWQDAFQVLRSCTEDISDELPPAIRRSSLREFGQIAQTPHAFYLPSR